MHKAQSKACLNITTHACMQFNRFLFPLLQSLSQHADTPKTTPFSFRASQKQPLPPCVCMPSPPSPKLSQSGLPACVPNILFLFMYRCLNCYIIYLIIVAYHDCTNASTMYTRIQSQSTTFLTQVTVGHACMTYIVLVRKPTRIQGVSSNTPLNDLIHITTIL